MRTYPLPQRAVDTARDSGRDDPLTAAIADGALTEDEILLLVQRQRAEGSGAHLGGESAQKWAAKMSQQFVQASGLCDSDCDDLGWYGVADPEDPNIIYGVVRTDGEGHEHWTPMGWEPFDDSVDLLILTQEQAKFAVDALLEGCDGVYLHPGTPMAYLAAGYWDESKYNRDSFGRFASKDGDTWGAPGKRGQAREAADYIRSGGTRPSWVKPLDDGKKGRGGGGGSGGGSSKKKGGSSSKKGGSSSKKGGSSSKKKGSSKEKTPEQKKKEAEKKKKDDARDRYDQAMYEWQQKKEDIRDEQTRLKIEDYEARLAEYTEDVEAAEELTTQRQELAAEYSEMILSGMDPVEADREIHGKMIEASRAAAEAAEERDEAERLRKEEYARQKVILQLLREQHELTKPRKPRILAAAEDGEDGDWIVYAVVDEMDPNAVMSLIRIRPGPEVESWQDGEWKTDPAMLAQLRGVEPPPLVELTQEQVDSILAQAAEEGVTAAISPDPRAAKLRAYWLTGKGRLKIKWGAPGDFTRCVRHLRKYIPVRAKGYCANLHKMATGMWPGDRRNRGVRGTGASEDVVWDAVTHGSWHPVGMEEAMLLADGVYQETDDSLVRALTAGATFPVAPPDDWFQNPGLSGPTPLTVDDAGRVFGHIATFDVPHIGMPGQVHAPKSRSGYAYFKTGQLRTASGADINVGQLTLAGGHAPLSADAKAAVEHYDNTSSAVADLNVGEDRYGIWAAGACRPEVTPEQLRAMRASAPSGDWRPINGGLELVAVCQVNVPGFPVARARVAGGAVMALVAAGARPLAEQQAVLTADATLMKRVAALEGLVMGQSSETASVDPGATIEEPAAATEVPPEVIAEEAAAEVPEAVARTREYIRTQRVNRLRDRFAASRERSQSVTAAMGGDWSTKSREKAEKKGEAMEGGSFPIHDKADLKRAIQAFGRAKNKDAAKKHIKKRARALGATDMLPDDWKK